MPRNQSEALPEVTTAQLSYLRAWVTVHPEEPKRSMGGAYGTGGCVLPFMQMNIRERDGICRLSWSVRKAIVDAQKSK